MNLTMKLGPSPIQGEETGYGSGMEPVEEMDIA
jgi:hypothetical protein